jgi:hypothetical protein
MDATTVRRVPARVFHERLSSTARVSFPLSVILERRVMPRDVVTVTVFNGRLAQALPASSSMLDWAYTAATVSRDAPSSERIR